MKIVVFNKKILLLILLLLVVVICSPIVISSTGVMAKEKKSLPIYAVTTDKKQVALTFDCAWGVEYTDELLSIMQSESVKSTFFTVQFWAEKYPDYLKKISDYGHEIGTHSATHSHMSKLSESQIIKELETSSNAITTVTGKKVDLFRAPFGDYNNKLIETSKNCGYYTIQWDVDSLDWKNLSSEDITTRVLKGVKNGSIVLFHNNGLYTAKALPSIIKALKAQGYEFVTVGELIYRENFSIDTNGRQFLL